MKRINILFIFIFSVPSATFSQQSDLLEKYRSMAVEYNHDLKAADKHISASIVLGKRDAHVQWMRIKVKRFSSSEIFTVHNFKICSVHRLTNPCLPIRISLKSLCRNVRSVSAQV